MIRKGTRSTLLRAVRAGGRAGTPKPVELVNVGAASANEALEHQLAPTRAADHFHHRRVSASAEVLHTMQYIHARTSVHVPKRARTHGRSSQERLEAHPWRSVALTSVAFARRTTVSLCSCRTACMSAFSLQGAAVTAAESPGLTAKAERRTTLAVGRTHHPDMQHAAAVNMPRTSPNDRRRATTSRRCSARYPSSLAAAASARASSSEATTLVLPAAAAAIRAVQLQAARIPFQICTHAHTHARMGARAHAHAHDRPLRKPARAHDTRPASAQDGEDDQGSPMRVTRGTPVSVTMVHSRLFAKKPLDRRGVPAVGRVVQWREADTPQL